MKIFVFICTLVAIASSDQCNGKGHYFEFNSLPLSVDADIDEVLAQATGDTLAQLKSGKTCGCICNPAKDSSCLKVTDGKTIYDEEEGRWKESRDPITSWQLSTVIQYEDIKCPEGYTPTPQSQPNPKCTKPCVYAEAYGDKELGISQTPNENPPNCGCDYDLVLTKDLCDGFSSATPTKGTKPCVYMSAQAEWNEEFQMWRLPYKTWETTVTPTYGPVKCNSTWTVISAGEKEVCFQSRVCPLDFVPIPCGPTNPKFQKLAIDWSRCVVAHFGNSNQMFLKGEENLVKMYGKRSNSGETASSSRQEMYALGDDPNNFKHFLYFLEEASNCIGYWSLSAQGAEYYAPAGTKLDCTNPQAAACTAGDLVTRAKNHLVVPAAGQAAERAGYFIRKHRCPLERFPTGLRTPDGNVRRFFTEDEKQAGLPREMAKKYLELMKQNLMPSHSTSFPSWGRANPEVWETDRRTMGVKDGEQDSGVDGPCVARQCLQMPIFVGNPQGLGGFTNQPTARDAGGDIFQCLTQTFSRWGPTATPFNKGLCRA